MVYDIDTKGYEKDFLLHTYKPNRRNILTVVYAYYADTDDIEAFMNLRDLALYLGYESDDDLINAYYTAPRAPEILLYKIKEATHVRIDSVRVILRVTSTSDVRSELRDFINGTVLIDLRKQRLERENRLLNTPDALPDVASNDYRYFNFDFAPFGVLRVYRIEGALYFNYADLVSMLDRDDTRNLMANVAMGDAFYIQRADANAVNVFGLARIIDAAPSLSADDRQQFKELIFKRVIPVATAVL